MSESAPPPIQVAPTPPSSSAPSTSSPRKAAATNSPKAADPAPSAAPSAPSPAAAPADPDVPAPLPPATVSTPQGRARTDTTDPRSEEHSPSKPLPKQPAALPALGPAKEASAEGEAAPAILQAPAAEAEAAAPAEDGVDRSEIEKNSGGCDEPSSADPELWNIDGCEVDMLVKYKMGGNLWYVQSRMRENPPQKPIPGFPINKKAVDAERYYAKEDEGEFNNGSKNFMAGPEWKKVQEANPPVAKA